MARPGREVAEAPDARPRQLHPVPRVRGRLPVELHLHAVAGHRRGRGRRRRATTRSTTRRPSSWSTTTRAPAARCASTDAPPTPCTMRDCPRVPRAGRARWPRSRRHRRKPNDRAGRPEETLEAEASVARRPGRAPAGDRGLEVDLPAGLDLPQGLQGHLARSRPRDDEQRALPPAPREGEAARAEADLHVLPGRALVLPVHPAHDHRHLPDVLLPADGRHRRRAGLHRHAEPSARRCSSATSCATCTDGAPT